MTKREIANLCCRVLAVYALIQGIQVISEVMSLLGYVLGLPYGPSGLTLQYLTSAVGPALMFVFAILLWRKSGVVAAWMVGHDLQDEQHEPDAQRQLITAREMHMIAFSVLGLWVLVEAVPAILAVMSQFVMAEHDSASAPYRESVMQAYSRSLVDLICRVLVGLWLLFGASGLVDLLRRARNFGLEERERPDYPQRDAGP